MRYLFFWLAISRIRFCKYFIISKTEWTDEKQVCKNCRIPSRSTMKPSSLRSSGAEVVECGFCVFFFSYFSGLPTFCVTVYSLRLCIWVCRHSFSLQFIYMPIANAQKHPRCSVCVLCTAEATKIKLPSTNSRTRNIMHTQTIPSKFQLWFGFNVFVVVYDSVCSLWVSVLCVHLQSPTFFLFILKLCERARVAESLQRINERKSICSKYWNRKPKEIHSGNGFIYSDRSNVSTF